MSKFNYKLFAFRDIAFPFAYFMVLGILYFFLIQTGLNKLSEQRRVIKSTQKAENILKEKEALLKDLQPTLPSYVTASTLALPEKNPALVVISQLKNFAGENAIFLEDLKIGSEKPATGRSVLGVSFKLGGTVEQVLNFLRLVRSSAPIITLTGIELSKLSGTGVSMDVKATFSWAAYPEKISSLGDPLAKLTKEELDTLDMLAKLKKSVFSTLTPQSPSSRVNPFAP